MQMPSFKQPPPQEHRALVAKLYTYYAPAMLMYIRRHILSREDAEDILLEVFTVALESQLLGELNEYKQRSWLWSVAHNKVMDYHRRAKHRVHTKLEDVEEDLLDAEEDMPEAAVLRDEAHAQVRVHLDTLSQAQQEIVRLRFAHGLRSPEIATLVNKSEVAVRVMLSRALNSLRGIYNKDGEESHNG
ncbi:RNA polymerase sigma factor [Dictyobacter kobayashii]|uniref:RNA polymerase sigma factor 70 region 4 type 2 domain-containing protein n=1 Tax=Dictyobacter kobayashii TaxID=2014872 RepID=A0A402AVA5_9CHLR|nr:sigma-70 family RNA polymerase sigma factor [Dictyobacter kobayashii]GCE23046.1 hypothetical protein KDK_68460 [Dictyobacter kobayashii]